MVTFVTTSVYIFLIIFVADFNWWPLDWSIYINLLLQKTWQSEFYTLVHYYFGTCIAFREVANKGVISGPWMAK